jgi:DNA-binding GntR family transcriptional regulator
MRTAPPPTLAAADPGLTLTAYHQLRGMVLSGSLVGGQIIQERRLAERLGLSRTPVRGALDRLEGEGLLRREGRVLICTTVSVQEVLEILSVRRSLEADAAQAAAARMTTGQIDAVRHAILGMADPASVTDDEHWTNDDLLHLSIAEASGNSLLSRLIRDLRQRTRMFGLRRIPGRFDQGKAEHLAILDAIAERDGDLARIRMRLHVEHARDAIVATLAGGYGA